MTKDELLKNIKLLSWHSFFTDFSLWAPIAILYFSKVTGSFTLGLSIFSITMVSSALFEIPTGIFSDFIGRRKTLILGAFAYLIGMILYAAGDSFLMLVFGAIFEGLGRSFYSGNNDALLYDSLAAVGEENDFDEYTGKISSKSQLAQGLSALLGGVVAALSFKWVMWLSTIPQLICLILGLMLVDVALKSKEDENIYSHLKEAVKGFVHNAQLRTLSITSIISYGIAEASYQFKNAFVAILWPIWAIGISSVLSSFGAAVSFHFSGRLIRRFKALTWILAGSIYSRIANLIALVFPSVLSPALMSTTSVFYGVGQTAKSALMQKEFTHQQRATMGSLNSFGGSFFFGIFAIFLGKLADMFGPTKALIYVQILQFGVLYLYLKLFMKDRKVVVSA